MSYRAGKWFQTSLVNAVLAHAQTKKPFAHSQRKDKNTSDDERIDEDKRDKMFDRMTGDEDNGHSPGNINTPDTRPHEEQCDNIDGNPRIFYEGQIIHDLNELEKLKAKYEECNFCEL